MRWRQGRRSTNIEDRRSRPGVRRAGGVGIVGIIIALGASMLFGIDPRVILSGMEGMSGGGTQSAPGQASPAEQETADFVSVVLGDTEDTWQRLFQQSGQRYKAPKLVMFSDSVSSACGFASAASGPFYCPGDQKVYLDLSFFRELKQRFGAPGDFAQAYVIAHEVGHHVQTLLGVSDQVRNAKARASKVEANAIQVRMELQADCLAGLWTHHAHRARNILEQGDLEEALRAANAIGDDTIQRRSQGYVVPDAFTHGSAEQRIRWFKTGLHSGSIESCNTFKTARL